jgi:hypothetical protein
LGDEVRGSKISSDNFFAQRNVDISSKNIKKFTRK